MRIGINCTSVHLILIQNVKNTYNGSTELSALSLEGHYRHSTTNETAKLPSLRFFTSRSKDSTPGLSFLEGKVLLIRLFPRTSCSSIVQLANDLGIFPCNQFSLKSIMLKLLGLEHNGGMVPHKLLNFRSSTNNEELRLVKP